MFDVKKFAFLALITGLALFIAAAQDNSSFWDTWNSQQEGALPDEYQFSDSLREKLDSPPERRIVAWTITVQSTGKDSQTYTVNTSDAGRASETAKSRYRSYYHMRPDSYVSVMRTAAVYNY
jgi:hypothetical protein